MRLLFRYIVAILLLVVGMGQEAHAQYVITNETTRCLTKQDSLLSDNFGQKVDGQLKSSYRADTVSLIDKYFRRGYVEKGNTDDSKGKTTCTRNLFETKIYKATSEEF